MRASAVDLARHAAILRRRRPITAQIPCTMPRPRESRPVYMQTDQVVDIAAQHVGGFAGADPALRRSVARAVLADRAQAGVRSRTGSHPVIDDDHTSVRHRRRCPFAAITDRGAANLLAFPLGRRSEIVLLQAEQIERVRVVVRPLVSRNRTDGELRIPRAPILRTTRTSRAPSTATQLRGARLNVLRRDVVGMFGVCPQWPGKARRE